MTFPTFIFSLFVVNVLIFLHCLKPRSVIHSLANAHSAGYWGPLSTATPTGAALFRIPPPSPHFLTLPNPALLLGCGVPPRCLPSCEDSFIFQMCCEAF